MLTNRSAPHARVVPVLTVANVRDAVDWYGRVLGFVEHVRIGEGHRAQLGLTGGPAAELIVAEARPDSRTPTALRAHQVMLKVADVASLAERAQAAGATLVLPVTDHEYGERQATLDDPFGHQWILTETLADTAPDAWGGEAITPRR
ncbi:MAG TPA: VOC family protein [Kofleriaceae bacterium]